MPPHAAAPVFSRYNLSLLFFPPFLSHADLLPFSFPFDFEGTRQLGRFLATKMESLEREERSNIRELLRRALDSSRVDLKRLSAADFTEIS